MKNKSVWKSKKYLKKQSWLWHQWEDIVYLKKKKKSKKADICLWSLLQYLPFFIKIFASLYHF